MTESAVAVVPALLPPDTAEAVIHNSYAVLDAVQASGDAVEAAGKLTPELARLFRDAGLFQMTFPASRGGLEMTLEQQAGIVARIARADASAGWNVGVLNASGCYAGRLGDDAYAELYPHRDMPTSGQFHPRGRADKVDGGYLVSGWWDWGSGSMNAEYNVGGALAYENGEPVMVDGGRHLLLGMWLPKDAVVFADNWQVMGVRGSGSTSTSIPAPGAFVPERFAFDREAPESADNDPLNKSVHVTFFGLAGVPLGIAQHLIDLAGGVLRKRAAKGGGAHAIDSATRQAFGQAVADVDYVFAGALEVARRTDEILFTKGRGITGAEVARMSSAQQAATMMLRRVLDRLIDHIPSTYLFDNDPFQRVIRDAYGAMAHTGSRATRLDGIAFALLNDQAAPLLLADTVPLPDTLA
jgi:indole-3-acetate monooxygenase